MKYRFGLLGKKLAHSLSKIIMEEFFDESGISGEYLLIELKDHKSFCRFASNALKEKVFDGFNVTVPYKEWAFSISKRKKEETEKTGSANVLYLENNEIVGANTDVYGFVKSLTNNFPDIKVGRALVVGAGGAARAVIYGLSMIGVGEIVVVSRTVEKALNLKNFFSEKLNVPLAVKNMKEVEENDGKFDLIVNATPVGMFPESDMSPLSEKILNRISDRGIVFDLIYNPIKTKLLRICEQRSINTLNGLEMLVLQAAESFRIWTGIYPHTEKAFKKAYKVLK